MRVLWLLACLSIGLISPAESNLRSASPMMGDGVQRTGPAGPQGEPGGKGDTGNAGSKGDTGGAGPAGSTGATGPAGAAGPKGDTGLTGAPGSTGSAGPAGPQGVQGPQGSQGAVGPAGAPKRVERYTVSSNTSAVATFTWPACASAPDVDIIPTWSGDQMIVGGVTTQTLSGATVAVKRSRGTLLLAAGPFEPAPSTPVTVRVICN